MKLFLLGSLAFDTLGRYEGHFRHLFSPELLEDLSVSFVLGKSQRHFGGCCGNVAYSLGLLGAEAHVCGVLGQDGAQYKERLAEFGMNVENLEMGTGFSAQAVIGTDLEGKQIAQFIPGALENVGAFEVPKSAQAGDLFWVGPERPDRMLSAVSEANARGLRVFVDPGQLTHAFGGKELLELVAAAEGVFANQFEWTVMQEKTGLSAEALCKKTSFVVVTQAERGGEVYCDGSINRFEAIPAVLKDPTGAGDAFRAGALFGLLRGWPLMDCIQAGALLGAASVEHEHAQGHRLSADQERVLKTLGSL